MCVLLLYIFFLWCFDQDLESMKRAQKQQQTSQGATEVRLNRALEEVEKYKTQLNKSKTDSKVESKRKHKSARCKTDFK